MRRRDREKGRKGDIYFPFVIFHFSFFIGEKSHDASRERKQNIKIILQKPARSKGEN